MSNWTGDETTRSAFDTLVGDRLYAVTFILNYIQLHFDRSTFNIYSCITITHRGEATHPTKDSFRNLLCTLIGNSPTSYRMDDRSFTICFGDSDVRISLDPEDFKGPEAATFTSEVALIVFNGPDPAIFRHDQPGIPIPDGLKLIVKPPQVE